VRGGERATGIEYWQWSVREAVKDEDGKPVLDDDGKERYQTYRLDRPRVFYAKVFNAEQIDGLAPWIAPAPSFDPLERAEAIVAGAGVPVLHDQHDRAFYRPMTDEIHLPPMAAFKGAAEYYETALHELGHATGHESRLDRFFGPFGSEGYAREGDYTGHDPTPLPQVDHRRSHPDDPQDRRLRQSGNGSGHCGPGKGDARARQAARQAHPGQRGNPGIPNH
jgi:antirestriction protein ArdC